MKPKPYKVWIKSYLKGPSWPEYANVVAIVWDDATYAAEVEQSGLARATTFGVVVEATVEYIKVAAEVFSDKTVRDVSTIPAGMVRGIYKLSGGHVE